MKNNTQWHVFFHFINFLYVDYCKLSFLNEGWHIFLLQGGDVTFGAVMIDSERYHAMLNEFLIP